ncbi:hypothetical protein HanXRQr2_Chr07g0314891 [Helianthus annuus]|uniref:Uncharacterized protein n=1 Tax=Helianthus annuus TaxID=4232 RepID=A0A251UDZ2_HELAN|nr:hypothetical protein HanXRQr2_Chr07g0314891 [Helianthus annuus]
MARFPATAGCVFQRKTPTLSFLLRRHTRPVTGLTSRAAAHDGARRRQSEGEEERRWLWRWLRQRRKCRRSPCFPATETGATETVVYFKKINMTSPDLPLLVSGETAKLPI